jgi:hypothetical protein
MDGMGSSTSAPTNDFASLQRGATAGDAADALPKLNVVGSNPISRSTKAE